MTQKHSWIRTVYLYLFALVGLTLVIIGAVRLLDMGMKIYIFTEADKPDQMRQMPPYPPFGLLETPTPTNKNIGAGDVKINQKVATLTEEEKTALNNWEIDYKTWQGDQSKIDYVKSNREKEASNALAFMLIGLPLYLYHWMVIKRDRKES